MRKYFPLRWSAAGISFLMDRRTVLILIVLLLVAVGILVASTGSGTVNVSPWHVLKAIAGAGSPSETMLVMKLRLPRSVVAFLVGASLAAAGAILQGMIRNPLASPDLIGITGGASVAAVWFISVFQKASIHWLPPISFAGALVIAAVIYLLAWKRGVSPGRLVLIGIGVEAAMHALTTLMIVSSPFYLTTKALTWMTGSVYGSSWKHVGMLLPWFCIILPAAFVLARAVNVQQLGDDTAYGVGNPVQKSRLVLLMLSVGLAGSAVAVGGAIGFVGLIAPHMARRLVGPAFGGLLPASALLGGIVVMTADWVARTAFAPLDLPVGLFTSLIGAPFFIYLLLRSRHQ